MSPKRVLHIRAGNEAMVDLGFCKEPNGGVAEDVRVDFSRGQDAVEADVLKALVKHEYDVLVGAGLGGWLAIKMGELMAIPYGVINPVNDPQHYLSRDKSMKAWVPGSYDKLQFDHVDILVANSGKESVTLCEALTAKDFSDSVVIRSNVNSRQAGVTNASLTSLLAL